jgi:hypothetical protein
MHKKVYGIKEIADMFGKSKQVISYWAKVGGYLPDPAYRISSGPIWTYEQLEPHVTNCSRWSIYSGVVL